MKYLMIVFLMFIALCSNADVKKIEVVNKVVIGGKTQSSVPADVNGVKLAAELSESCKCKTQYQGNVYFEYVAPSSSSKSFSSSSASSSVARVTLTWQCTLQRENGQTMTESEIQGYSIVGTPQPLNIKHTGCNMSYIIDAPASGQVIKIAEIDNTNLVSKYVAFE